MATKKRTSIPLPATGIDWSTLVLDPPEAPAAAEPAPAPSSGVMRRVLGDGGIALLKGAIAVPEAAVGLADLATDGRVGKALENEGGDVGFRPDQARKVLDQYLTPEQQAANAAVQNAEGFTGKLGAAVTNPSTIASTVAESLPLMLGGAGVAGGLARLAPRMGAVVAGAAGEGVVSAGSAAEQIRQETADGLLTGKQAALAAASGVGTGVLSVLGGKVAQRLGIGDVDTLLAQATMGRGAQRVAAQETSKGFVRKVLEGAVSEGVLEELPQSIQEQVLQNAALNKPLDEGVDYAAVMGLLSGAVMGGAAAPLHSPGDQLRQDKLPERGPMTRAVNAAVEAAAQKADAGVPVPADPTAPPPPAGSGAAQAGVTAMLDEERRKAEQAAAGQALFDRTYPGAAAAPTELLQPASPPEAGFTPAAVPAATAVPDAAAARAQREADKPPKPTGDPQEGDILNAQGKPFASMDVAMRRLAEAGGEATHELVRVRGGLVVRPKAGVAPAVVEDSSSTPGALGEDASSTREPRVEDASSTREPRVEDASSAREPRVEDASSARGARDTDAPPAAAGQPFTLDGKTWTLKGRTDTALTVLDADGQEKKVPAGGKLGQRITAALAGTGETAPAAAAKEKGTNDGQEEEGRLLTLPGAGAATAATDRGESNQDASPTPNQERIDGVPPAPRAVTIAGEQVALDDEQAAEWDRVSADYKTKFDAAKATYERTKDQKPTDDPDMGLRSPKERFDAESKRLGMELSAERRRIAGKLTAKEQAAADADAAKIRVGDTVDTPEGTGEVTGNTFGQVRVKIGDRTVVVPHKEAKKVKGAKGAKEVASPALERVDYPPAPPKGAPAYLEPAQRAVVDHMNGDLTREQLHQKFADLDMAQGAVSSVTNRIDWKASDDSRVQELRAGRQQPAAAPEPAADGWVEGNDSPNPKFKTWTKKHADGTESQVLQTGPRTFTATGATGRPGSGAFSTLETAKAAAKPEARTEGTVDPLAPAPAAAPTATPAPAASTGSKPMNPAPAPAPAPSTDPTLDDELNDALGKLGDVLGDVFGAKKNITGPQYGAADLLPALSKVIELLVRKGFKSFAQAAGKAATLMRANEKTAPHVDAITPRQWKAAYNAIAEGTEGTDSEEALSAMTADEVRAIVRPTDSGTPATTDAAQNPASKENTDEQPTQPPVGAGDQGGSGTPGRERGARPQQRDAQADPGNVEGAQPGDVGQPDGRGPDAAAGEGAAGADVGPAGGTAAGRNAGDGRPRAGRKGAPDAGARGRGGRAPADGAGKPVDPATVSPANPGPGDFVIADSLRIVGGGQVARFDKNKAAIDMRNRLVDAGRAPTREEQEVLAGYTGWGSFGQELFQGTWDRPAPKKGWEERDQWLRDNMGRKEWEGMQTSIINAHYTDPPTVMAMWDMVRRMGFTGGRTLEPSIGIGNFYGLMPADMTARSQRAGIELDPMTGSMAQMLYPQANIQIKGYEESTTPDNFYDLVIGNWPFFEEGPADRRYNRLSPTLHDYFFLKAIDQTKPGGLIVGITTKGTMDKKGINARMEMARKADLVAAFRLPSGAFEEYAGTKVVTDIIILRKRERPTDLVADAGWINVKDHDTAEGTKVPVNEYFHRNPSHVIGRIDFGHGTTTFRPGLIVHRPDDMMGELRRIVDLVPEGAFRAGADAKRISYVANHTSDRTNSLVKTGKGFFIVQGEYLAPANEVAKYELKDAKKTAKREKELAALIDLRRLYAKLIDAEREGKGDEPRAALRAAYDAFVKESGPLAESFGLGYLRRIDDPFYPSLAALEISTVGKDGKPNHRPAAILTQSTMRGAAAMKNPSITDAFVLARNQTVNPPLSLIAEIAKKPEAEVKKALIEAGASFELPNGDFVPSDVYLSGNVREKLREAQDALKLWISENVRKGDDGRKLVGEFGGQPLYIEWRYKWSDEPTLVMDFPGKVEVPASPSWQSLETQLRQRRDTVESNVEQRLSERREKLAHARKVAVEPFHMADKLAEAKKKLADLEEDIARNPVAPPYWLRAGAPMDTDVIYNGKTFTVTGHRWSDTGYYVVGTDERGEFPIPYMEARDNQGMPLYEEREFKKPVVVQANGAQAVPPGGMKLGDAYSISDRSGGWKVLDRSGNPYAGQPDFTSQAEAQLWADTRPDPTAPADVDAKRIADLRAEWERDNGPAPVFSRASGPNRGVPMTDAKAVIAAIRAVLPTAPPIHPLETLSQAPRALREKIKAEGAEDLEAAYHAGEIYVFPRNISSIERMQFVVGHHEIRHHGIRMRLGTGDELGAAMHAMWAGNQALRKAAQAKIDAGLANTRALAVEEALADMPAEQIAKFKGFQRLIAAVRQWLRQVAARLRNTKMPTLADMVEPKTWTDADVANFVLRAEGVSRGDTAIFRAGGTVFGRPDGADQTQTPAFRRWFGNSKVVDADGKPLRVYHGTGEDFSVFKNGVERGGDPLYAQTGLYFAEDSGISDIYGDREGGNVMPVYLSIKDPLDLTDESTIQGWKGAIAKVIAPRLASKVMREEALRSGLSQSLIMQSERDKLMAAGYDGIKGAGGVWIAFKPEQIKSAIGNNGQFDPTNPSIVFSRPGASKLTAQDLVNATGGVFDFNRLGETKQDRIRTIMDAGRPGWLGLLTRDQIADVYGQEIPPVKEYDKLTRQMENQRSKIAQDADDLYNEWAKLPAEKNDQLARMMLDATIYSVHPDGNFIELDRGNDAERQQVHDRLKAQFDSMGADAQAIYRKVRDFHQGTLTQLRDALLARVERQVENGQAKAAALTKIRTAFDAYLEEGPYFPLSRFGDFIVVGNRAEDGERVVASYATAGEQLAAARTLEADGFTVKLKTAKTYSRETDGSAGKFIGDVLTTLDNLDMRDATVGGDVADLKTKLMDDVNQLFIKALPDLSYRKHFMHRKGTPGFSSDMMRGFASSAFHAASHIARLNHGDKMTFALQDAFTAIEQAPEGDFNLHSQVLNELTKRHDAALNPNTHPVAAMLNQVGFIMYLGLSPAAGLINMLQTVMVTMPHLGARYGFGRANKVLAKSLSDITTGAKANAKNGWNAAQSTKLTAAERTMMSELQDEGVIDLTQAHDLSAATGLDTGNVARSKAAFAMARAMKIVGWTFHIPEVMNRQVTALAAYRMEMQKTGDVDKAKDAAREAIKRTHFDYSTSNRARFMQGNVSRVLLQFKQYSQNMTYLLGRAAYQAMKGEDPEVRAIARRQLVATFAVTWAMAGALGLPAVGGIAGMIGMMMGAAGGDDEPPWDWKVEFRNLMADTFGKEAGEVISHGIPRALIPWDISNRVSLGDLWFRDSGREGQSPREAFATDMANILGPTAGTVLGLYTAADHMARGNWSKAVESMTPKALRDPLKAIREGREGVTSYNGEPLMEITGGEVLGRLLGFAPARASEMYEGKAAVMNAKTAIEQRRQALVGKVAKARISGDGDTASEVMVAITAFNKRNPDFKITSETIRKAIATRRQNRANTQDGILLPSSKAALRERGRFAEVEA